MRIRVHASFLLLFVLVFLGGVKSLHEMLVEAGWILALFACVVIHELAHSVTATRLWIKVQDIVLFPLGGATEMERMPDAPGTELAVAGAGPAASLVLGGLLLGISAGAGESWWPPAVFGGSILVRLLWVNVLLAGFNLLPVLPMDGGRILRALLEPKLGRTGSTITAARIGMVGGGVLVAVGLLYNLWLAFIGIFILLGARIEGANAEVRGQLSAYLVRDAMIPLPLTAEAQTMVDAHWLDGVIGRQGVLPVTRNGLYAGVLGPAQRHLLASDRPVGEAMDAQAPALGPEDPLDRAIDLFQESSQPAIVVVGPGRQVLGVVVLEGLEQMLTGPMGRGR